MAGKQKKAPESIPAEAKAPAAAAKKRPAAKKPAKTPAKKTPAKRDTPSTHGKHAKRPTAAEKALIAERRQFVWGLYRRRISDIKITQHLIGKREHIGFRDLAEKVNEAGWQASLATVHNDIQVMIAERKERLAIDNDVQFAIDLDRLDDMQASIASRVEKHGKPDDIKAELMIMDRRDKYLNITKARQDADRLREALISFLGFDPEAEVPNAESSDGN